MNINEIMKHALSALIISSASTMAFAKVPQVGDVIDASNVDQYSEYLIESAIALVKQGQVLKVTPTSEKGSLSNPEFLQITEANKGKARILDEYGTLGLEDGSPWIGGLPFPVAEKGIEVMVNYQFESLALEGDDFGHGNGPNNPISRLSYVDKDGNIYKEATMGMTSMLMTGRSSGNPGHTVPGHEDEQLRRMLKFIDPYDVKGIVSLDIQYRDQSKLPESYVYLPSFRRVRQVATANRADALAGSDLTQADLGGFSDPLGLWKFKIIKKGKMLVNVMSITPTVRYPKPITLHNKYFPQPQRQMELREAYVIEATPRYDMVYGKKIMVFDAEVYRLSDAGFYDNSGKLYKGMQQDFAFYEGNGNHPIPSWMLAVNFQTGGATVFANIDMVVNHYPSPTMLDKSEMKNLAR
ncbi:DUF1329 domain-containing protein [Cycloclasticus sp. P1]|uniref:DUF1329 domain-containing protein n=1 Tax=Cycloclasticus sp. (strain P1) TaxID=385025 RepID=UPI0002F82013|nr:DUF1329 domain-containing protein [Cycloclasticus sp. P1]